VPADKLESPTKTSAWGAQAPARVDVAEDNLLPMKIFRPWKARAQSIEMPNLVIQNFDTNRPLPGSKRKCSIDSAKGSSHELPVGEDTTAEEVKGYSDGVGSSPDCRRSQSRSRHNSDSEPSTR
jgi:hypothetical protein